MSYYDPDDPWSEILEPSIAPQFRAALRQELDTHMQPFREAEADRQFAQEETKMRAVYGDKFYTANRQAILNFAIENNVADLDVAVRAWRGSGASPTVEGQSADSPDSEKAASDKRKARIEELRYNDTPGARDERAHLKHLESEYADRRTEALFARADGGEHNAEVRRNANQEHNQINAHRTDLAARGHFEAKAPSLTREEMDLRTEQLFEAAESSDQ